MPTNTDSLQGPVLDEHLELSLTELCESCHVEVEFVIELVQEGVLDPVDARAPRWTFTGPSLIQLRRAANLHRDLGINLAGLALVLELLEERERLRAELASWQRS